MSKKIGRNDPCPCGSGKKYKSCCWKKNQASAKQINATILKSSGMANIFKNIAAQPQSVEKKEDTKEKTLED